LSILQYPILLKEDEFIKLWYKKDIKFKIPKGKIYQNISSHNSQNIHCSFVMPYE
jgi:secreted Zn-dependent insulinase-like peptidase